MKVIHRKTVNLDGLARLGDRFDCTDPFSLVDSFNYALDGVIYDGIDGEFEEDIKQLAQISAIKFLEGISKIITVNNVKEVHDAIKRRSEEISDFLRESQSLAGLEALFLDMSSTSREYSIDIHKNIRLEKGASLYGYNIGSYDDELKIFEFKFKPKYMAKIYATMIYLAQLRADAVNGQQASLARYILEVMLVLFSQTKIFNLFRSSKEERLKQEEETISMLTRDPEPYTGNIIVQQLFSTVVKDISEGKLPYIKDIAQQIKSLQNSDDFLTFGQKDYYISSKACSYRGGGRKYQPALISSLCEIDSMLDHEMDQLIGYKSGYRESPIYRERLDMITLSIPQNKYKWRIIHLMANSIQDRGQFIHNRLGRLLSRLRSDCTFNQKLGVEFLERITVPRYRERNGNPTIIGMDFSNATDTLDLQFQLDCLRIIFPEAIVKFWEDISSSKKVFIHCDKHRSDYIQTTGQPQGTLGSFVSFAFAHHILCLMTMRSLGLEKKNPWDFYRVLGDDSVLTSILRDPQNELLRSHKRNCEAVGFKVNMDKTVVVSSQDSFSLVEFAKVSVLDGVIATPLPLKLMARSSNGLKTKIYGRLALYVWMSQNKYSGAEDALINTINESFHNVRENRMTKVMLKDIFPQLKFSLPESTDKLDNLYRFIYIVEKLKGSMLSPFINDKDMEDFISKPESSTLDTRFITKEGLDPILNELSPSSNHKIWSVIESNLQISEALRSIIKGGTLVPTFELSQEEMKLIFSISDILEQDIDLGLAEILRMDPQDLMEKGKVIKQLDRFLPRSYYKRIAKESQFIETAIGQLNKIYSASLNTLGINLESME